MREILFRGKRTDNDEWVYGYYYAVSRDRHPASLEQTKAFIKHETWDEGFDNFEVDPETIGQYTGLKDKNGTKIFEGDILVYEFEDIGKQKAYVDWNGKYSSFTLEVISEDFEYAPIESGVVIGNIYDNPELLKGE